MEIKKYIESGILEQYVLGTLDEKSVKEVESHMNQYPELRAEVMAIEDALESYAQAHGVKPPAGLENIILSKIDEEITQNKKLDQEKPSTSRIQEKPKSSNFWTYAAIILALACLTALWKIFAVNSESKTLKYKYEKLEQSHIALKNDCEEVKSNSSNTEKYLAFIQDQNTKPISMAGTDKAKEALSTIFWNPTKQKSYLRTVAMPEVPQGKQYQLWAIVDGKPVDMGVFDVAINPNEFIEVPFIEKPQAFAVTLEIKGGVESPTLEEMYVIGENS